MPLTNTPNNINILTPDFAMPEHCGGDHWSILHGDSLQIIRQFEPASFDAIITDPPYASGGSGQTKTRTPTEKYSSMGRDRALVLFSNAAPLCDSKYPTQRHPRYELLAGHPGSRYPGRFDYGAYLQERRRREAASS